MAFTKLLVLSVIAVAIGADKIIPPSPPLHSSTESPLTSSTTEPSTTSDPPITTKPTTTKPTSTTPDPTPTTSKPTPTTTKPTPTTTKPTPTTPKPTPTTPKPSPTTPAPTPKPGPVPEPEPNTWSVNKTNTNITCIIAKIAIQIDIPIDTNNTFKVNVPKNATASGKCDDTVQTISLQWSNNSVTFTFQKVVNTSNFELESVLVSALVPGENGTKQFNHHKEKEFVTGLQNSYRCDPEQKLNLTGSSDKMNATLLVKDVQLQAFRTVPGTSFSDAIDCLGTGTPDVVPIAVGCALVILVIFVVVGYLIGRRRSQARGYLSMFAETKREEDYIPMKTLSCFK